GVTVLSDVLAAKRLELLCELLPNATVIAFLESPLSPYAKSSEIQVRNAAKALHRQLSILEASSEADLDKVAADLKRLKPHALLVADNAFFNTHRARVIALA